MRLTRPRPLLLLAVALVAASGLPLHGAPPLAERVEIRRDTFGVPHILAEDVEAAGYGFGYAMAEDHAAELGRRYLRARGEAARALGPAELDTDLAMRRFDNRGVAQRALHEDTGRDFRRWLSGFAAGVNAYSDAHRDRVPAWMPLVEPSDPIAYGRMFGVLDAARPPARLLEKYRVIGGVVPGVPQSEDGSNAFALAGSRTQSGRPVLLGNPHLAWSSLYWEAHVTVPRRINFYGSTLVGIPVLRAGFNDRLAYVQTNNAPDLEDIYRLRLAEGRSDAYVHEGKTWPIEWRGVTADVLQEDGAIVTVRRAFEFTALGPVVHRALDLIFVVRSIDLEWTRGYEGFFELQQARSLREFRRTLGRRLTVTSNYTYADADGNILYAWNARLPRRDDEHVDYSLDVDGSSRRLFWTGIHPLDDLPALLNPSGGYVQNANNPPWWTSLRDAIDPSRYPDYIEPGQLSLRAQLALEELDAPRRLSADEVRALKYTTRMLAAERTVPDLLEAVKRLGAYSEVLRAGAAALAAWDRRADARSEGAVLFDRFQTIHQPFAARWDPASPTTTPRGLGNIDAALASLERAVEETRAQFGSERIAWGDVHRFRAGDLDLPGNGAPARLGTYRVVGFDAAAGGGRRVAGNLAPNHPLAGFGDAWVLLVHLTQPVTAWSVLAYGQTTDLASPHSRDQLRLFADHQLRTVWFSEADIAANLERRYRPAPVMTNP